MDLLILLAGVGLLYLGGEGLVRGGAGVGRRFGLSPMVIGLTVVSGGTSSPELAASLVAVLEGSPAIAVGNVIGSNIANLGLVLGLTAIVWPLAGSLASIGRDTAVMLAASLALLVLVGDDQVSRLEGLALLAAIVIYLASLLRRPLAAGPPELPPDTPGGRPWTDVVMIVGGTALLVLGAHLLVTGAVGLARGLGISERIVGLTMVAFGTSLPELASSLVAAFRHHSQIVLGNLIGSNIFNILFILGGTASVRPVAAPAAELRTDLLVMLGIGVLAPVLLVSGRRLSRWEGGLLLLCYLLYVALLFR